MDVSHVIFHGAEFDTSIDCSKCGSWYEGCIPADSAEDAARISIAAAREAGWTDGPLCPDCSKKKNRKPRKKK